MFSELIRQIDEADIDLLEKQSRSLSHRAGQIPRGWQINRDLEELLSEGESAHFSKEHFDE